MRYKKVFSIVLIAASFMMIYSCGSTEETATSKRKEVEEPFQSSEYYSDTEYFRAVGDGTSPDLSMSKDIAMTNAQDELAEQVQTKVSSVGEEYKQQRDIEDETEFDRRYQELTRTVVDQQLTNATAFDKKTFEESDGKYTHYVAIQMPVDPMKRKLENKISKDEKLRQDYDKKQFEETFEKEMKNLKEEQDSGK